MKRAFLFVLTVVALTAAAVWVYLARPVNWRKVAGISPGRSVPSVPLPDAGRYATLKEEVERWREDLSAKYSKARTPAEKDKVLAESRRFLEAVLPEMMRCWLGTRWDFNGTSEVPGEGNIACGYFVSTILRDAGFRVDRYKLARQPSQNILRSFLPRESLSLRVGVPYDSYAAELEAVEPGIRVIGLDSHVAFVVTGPEGFHFIHSSGSAPWCVVEECRTNAEVLRRSNYRVEGSLTADKNLLRRWLAGERIAVKGDAPATTNRR